MTSEYLKGRPTQKDTMLDVQKDGIKSPHHLSPLPEEFERVDSFEFKEEVLPKYVSKPVPSGEEKPYWIIDVLTESMQSGGYITPNLFVPKAVWFQTNVKLVNQGAKINYCTAISNLLVELQKTPAKNEESILKALDKFSMGLEFENEFFRKSLMPKQTSLFNSFVGYVTGTKQEIEPSYIPFLMEVLENLKIFQIYINLYQENTKWKGLLKKIAEQLSKGFLKFALDDLNILLEAQFKHFEQSL
jgi:hypothetical protein